MGVCMGARALSDDKISAVLADPPLVWRIVAPDDDEPYLREIGQSKPPNFLARFLGDKRQWPPEIPSFDFSESETKELDIDKSWDGINYCLKKLGYSAKYPNFFEDGKPVGKVEVGYGPAMCFTSHEVARIADHYSRISENDLLAQLIPSDMKGVYPDALWSKGDEDTKEYLTENFRALNEFLEFGRQHNVGAVVWFS